MKNGILICSGEGREKNIGDFMQSVAQEQFYDKVDCFVEREHMDVFQSDEKVNVVMGAWFMFYPENFPPSDAINPLFTSFHIVPKRAERLLVPRTVEYLKKYEPIGARDIQTKEILEAHGIKSYFSSCLTLTLGIKYKSEEKSDEVIFVDPYYQLGGGKHSDFRKYFDGFLLLIKHWNKVMKLKRNFRSEFHVLPTRVAPNSGRLLYCASFYDAYSKVFDDEVLFNAVYIKHNVPQRLFKSINDKMSYTKDLIRRYSKAKLVVTSRLHCALPCLGIETPVIFSTASVLEEGKHRGPGRLKGNLELLNTIRWEPVKGVTMSDSLKEQFGNRITSKSEGFTNPEKYKEYRDKLIHVAKSFVKQNS